MPGFLLHAGATVMCAHGGQAQVTAPNPRVRVSGQPTATTGAPYVVAGCPLPPSAGGPCVTAQWAVGTVRLLSSGQPLVLAGGVATCVPTGVPLTAVVQQMRVRGT